MIELERLGHSYGDRVALDDVSLSIDRAEIFCFLGPNGSGKTTLFRILSTLIPPTRGHARILGHDVVQERDQVRRIIGVVFQSPSLDRQLTAEENLRHHGHLFGLRGLELTRRIAQMLEAVGMSDRASERVEKLSGGMRRRVELAKGMLPHPRILLLDEPSTGLDPGARIDLWDYLARVRRDENVTIVLTTHLMDEADRCDRLAILDRGRLLACDSPSALKSTIGGDVITLTGPDLNATRQLLIETLQVQAELIDDTLRFERRDAHVFVPRIVEALPRGSIDAISISRPTLEDVFVRLTGHRLREG